MSPGLADPVPYLVVTNSNETTKGDMLLHKIGIRAIKGTFSLTLLIAVVHLKHNNARFFSSSTIIVRMLHFSVCWIFTVDALSNAIVNATKTWCCG